MTVETSQQSLTKVEDAGWDVPDTHFPKWKCQLRRPQVAFPVVAMGFEETGGGSDQSGKPVLSPAEVGLTKVEEGVGETEEAFPRGERICGWARVAAPKVVETRCGGAGRADQGRLFGEFHYWLSLPCSATKFFRSAR